MMFEYFKFCYELNLKRNKSNLCFRYQSGICFIIKYDKFPVKVHNTIDPIDICTKDVCT